MPPSNFVLRTAALYFKLHSNNLLPGKDPLTREECLLAAGASPVSARNRNVQQKVRRRAGKFNMEDIFAVVDSEKAPKSSKNNPPIINLPSETNLTNETLTPIPPLPLIDTIIRDDDSSFVSMVSSLSSSRRSEGTLSIDSINGSSSSSAMPTSPSSETIASLRNLRKLTSTKVRGNTRRRVYNTVKQRHTERQEAAEAKTTLDDIDKYATQLYDAGQKGKGKKLTQQQAAAAVSEKFNVNYPWRRIGKLCRRGFVGVSPPRPGRKGRIIKSAFKALCAAVVTYIEINQENGVKEPDYSGLAKRVNLVVNSHKDEPGTRSSFDLLDRILSEPSVSCAVEAGKEKQQEARRNIFCSYFQINDWLEEFLSFLIEHGFGVSTEKLAEDLAIADDQYDLRPDDGPYAKQRMVFFKTLRRRLINFDETGLGCDQSGKESGHGGRPRASFFSTRRSRPGSSRHKSSTTGTLVVATNADGEVLPTHLQFTTAAKSDDTQKLESDAIPIDAYVSGLWGLDERKAMPCGFGMNEKGGMDEEHFAKMIKNTILPVYPDAAPYNGKWVCLLTDSGPGRTNAKFNSLLRTLGFLLYPGLPNSTHITQIMDQLFGLFKSLIRDNLRLLTDFRIATNHGKDASIKRADLAHIVFGSENYDFVDGNTEDDGVDLVNCVEKAFSPHYVRKAWRKVGICPFTKECLNSEDVRNEITTSEGEVDDTMDPKAKELETLEQRNHLVCDILNSHGYAGDHLKVSLNRRTVENFENHRYAKGTLERAQALSRATTVGQRNQATGGDHLSSDDRFKGDLIKEKENKIIELTKKREDATKQATANSSLDAVRDRISEGLPLRVPDLKLLIRSKGKTPAASGRKIELEAQWATIKDLLDSGSTTTWTDEDEIELEYWENLEISIENTHFARIQAQQRAEVRAGVYSMGMDELEEIQRTVTEQLTRLQITEEENEESGDD